MICRTHLSKHTPLNFNGPTSSVVGFHHPAISPENIPAHAHLPRNATAILGWLPYVGVLGGIVRIALSCFSMTTEERRASPPAQRHFGMMSVRGLIEISPYRHFLIIPDILFTLGRYWQARL